MKEGPMKEFTDAELRKAVEVGVRHGGLDPAYVREFERRAVARGLAESDARWNRRVKLLEGRLDLIRTATRGMYDMLLNLPKES
jgi:hypothetical protein